MSRAFKVLIRSILCVTASILVLFGIRSAAVAGSCDELPTITGRSLPTSYSGALNAIQDNPTGFGDATPPFTGDTEGNELDALYLRNDATADLLYIGITGNTERNDAIENTVLVFIDSGPSVATAVLNTASFTGGSNALRNMSGATLDFAPEYALAAWMNGTTPVGVLHDLTNPTDAGTTLVLNTSFAVNNNNLVGVNGEPANDPLQQQVNAATASLGFEFAIAYAALGGITDTSAVNVQALLVNGAGFISNQSLPPLNPTSGSTGGGIACVGAHAPTADPPVVIDFANYTGNQFVPFTLSASGTSPGAIDGTAIPSDYGAPALKSTQNNYTCFGDAAPFSPLPSGGSELDRLYARNDFSKLYIGVTGNIPIIPDFNNSILVFIDTGSGKGANPLITSGQTGGSGALQGMDGITLDAGFAPDFVLEYWRGGNQHNAILHRIGIDPVTLGFSIESAEHTNIATNAFSADLSNILGINDVPGDDPIRQEVKAATALSGIQFSVRLSELGLTDSSSIKMAALIASGSGFVANQCLPPLNPTITPPATGSVSFNNAPLPLAIPDNNPAGVNDTRAVTMPGVDRITDINVTVNITHPQVSNLTVTLTNTTANTSVVLWNPTSGSGANLAVTFDSEGGGGTILPLQSLLSFNGLDPNSEWMLTVTDTVTGNTGTLNSWGFAVEDYLGGNVGCLGQFNSIENPIDFGSVNLPGNQYLTVGLSPTGIPASTPTNSLFSGQNIPFLYGGAAPQNNPPGGTLPAVPVLTTQNNYTCFGDAVTAPPTNLPGSELDRMFVRNTNDRLQVAITGNLENNANACVLLLDTNQAVGNQTITGQTSPPTAVGGNGTNESGLNGLTLDAGFTPNFAVVVQRDNTAGVPANDYNVYIKNLTNNTTRTLGRLSRDDGTDTGDGVLAPAVPNQNGSELDQLFIQNDANNLYLGLTGNLEANGNGYVIFIETAPTGANFVSTINGMPQILRNMEGDTLDAGFEPNLALVMTRNGGTYIAQLVDLTDLTFPPTVTSLAFNSTIGSNRFFGDNSNSQGVNSNFSLPPLPDPQIPTCPDDPVQQAINAATATRGVQFAISRASIGSPADGAAVEIGAYCVGSSGFWSNQTLPPLGGCQLNLGDGANLTGPTAPGNQFLSYTLANSGGYAAPSGANSFNGSDIPGAMAGALKSTQNTFTQFGDAVVVNPGNANCTQVALDDGNILGVTACSTPGTPPFTCNNGSTANVLLAESGLEFDLAFQDVGLTPLDMMGGLVEIKLMSVVTGRFGYFSNQFLPPLGIGNSRNLGNIVATPTNQNQWSGNLTDNAQAPGNQYLSYTLLVPCSSIPGDIDGDGDKDANDVSTLVNVLLGTDVNACHLQKADVNMDGLRNGRDIQPFVTAFLAP